MYKGCTKKKPSQCPTAEDCDQIDVIEAEGRLPQLNVDLDRAKKKVKEIEGKINQAKKDQKAKDKQYKDCWKAKNNGEKWQAALDKVNKAKKAKEDKKRARDERNRPIGVADYVHPKYGKLRY